MWGMLFRLPWWAYLAIAPVVLAGAGYAYFENRANEAEKAVALRQSPPPAVAIEAFDPARNIGRASEVVVTGQVDLAHALELTETKRGVERHHWTIAPIYPAGAADTNAPAPAIFVHDGAVTEDQMRGMIVGDGNIGPLMRIDGVRKTDFSVEQAVRQGLTKVKMAANPVLIDPFVAGRNAGLAPDPDAMGGSYVMVGLALGCAGFGFYRRSRRPVDEDTFADEAAPVGPTA